MQLLGIRDGWTTPIVVHALSPAAVPAGSAPASLHLAQTGVGLKFQLDLRIEAELHVPEIERALLQAVYVEMMYRSRPALPAGAAYVQPPDWLIEGTLALAPGREIGAETRALQTALAGRLLPLAEFLTQERARLDSPSRTLYRGYSAALLALLQQRPDGKGRLGKYLTDLPESGNDSLAELCRHFPELAGDGAETTELWRAAVVRVAESGRDRILSLTEGERALVEILPVRISREDKAVAFALSEFKDFLRDRAAPAELGRIVTELTLLSGRVHPLQQPILLGYQRVASHLQRKKTRGLPRQLAELRAAREGLARRMEGIADYLNWHEATQARTTSGAFREYLRAAQNAQKGEVRRRDPISVYLDALERQF